MTEDLNPKNNLPTHTVYWVSEGKEKSAWMKAGAGWLHKDGEGMNLDLNLLPRDGKLVIQKIKLHMKKAKS